VTEGIRGRVERVMLIEVSGREEPRGGYEVVSKRPLGKFPINIIGLSTSLRGFCHHLESPRGPTSSESSIDA
jgi:hypothetical protein